MHEVERSKSWLVEASGNGNSPDGRSCSAELNSFVVNENFLLLTGEKGILETMKHLLKWTLDRITSESE